MRKLVVIEKSYRKVDGEGYMVEGEFFKRCLRELRRRRRKIESRRKKLGCSFREKVRYGKR